MHAIWFEEKEFFTRNGVIIRTGRKRRNVSHFACDCGNVELVDDTFVEAWTD